MNFIEEVFVNQIFISAFWAWLIAQVLKTIIYACINHRLSAERLIGSGGMPSSHSSTVCALATSSAIIYGGNSFEFGMALIFAIIIMHDASGVRREAGNHAKILNEIMETLIHPNKELSSEERLKEFVGHTPLQVGAGAILGIIIALFVCL